MQQLISSRGAAALVVVALAVILTALAYLYQTQEAFFYYWDWRGYHGIAADFSRSLFESPGEAVDKLAVSMAATYNLLFAIPLAPLLAAGDYSRTAYVLSLTAIYLTFYCLLVGMICRRAFPNMGATAFVSGLLLVAFVPTVWVSVMRGYPDVLAAALVLCGLAVAMSDSRFRHWRSVLAVAFLLALAVAVRRHLAYAAVALILTIGMIFAGRSVAILRRQGLSGFRGRAWGGELVRHLAIPMLFALMLGVANPHLVSSVLTVDYGELYGSYQYSPLALLAKIVGVYLKPVLATLLLAGLLTTCLRLRQLDRPAGLALLFFLCWAVIWGLFAGQSGKHHMIVVVPPLLVFAVLMTVQFIRDRFGARMAGAALAIAAALVVGNGVYVHAIAEPPRLEGGVANIWGNYFGPLARSDFDVVRQLTGDLRRGPQPTLVAASNGTMNYDLLHDADRRLFRGRPGKLSLIVSPQVDSRDALPIEDLLRADQVVITRPLQYHLADAKEQQVVGVLLDLFAESEIVRRRFSAETKVYRHEPSGKVVSRVYRRGQVFSFPEAVALFEYMRRGRCRHTRPVPRLLVLVAGPAGAGLALGRRRRPRFLFPGRGFRRIEQSAIDRARATSRTSDDFRQDPHRWDKLPGRQDPDRTPWPGRRACRDHPRSWYDKSVFTHLQRRRSRPCAVDDRPRSRWWRLFRQYRATSHRH